MVDRRRILKEGAALAIGAGLLPGLGATTASAQAGGKVIIGAFADGALTPFKDKIIPLAKAEAGFEIEFLEDEYGVTLEKWFADAQSGAGQYDVYLLDDPWVPQFGAAEVLEDLGAAGIDGSDPDWIGSMIDMGFWPPRQGPRVKGFEYTPPKLISVPFIGDLQTLTYRNDVYKEGAPQTWDELIAKGKEAVAAGTIKYPVVFRGVSGNADRRQLVSGVPVVRRRVLRRQVERDVQFGGRQGLGRFLRRHPESKCAGRRGRIRLRSGRCGDPRRRSGRHHPVFGQRAEGRRSETVEGRGQTRLRSGAEAGKGDRPDRHLHRRRAEIGPQQGERDRLPKWFVSPATQAKLSQAGALPVKRTAFQIPDPGNRLIPVALQQFDAGALPRPRTPDWAKVEEFLGIELNKALQAGSGGGAALDAAAVQVTDYLKQAGYYE